MLLRLIPLFTRPDMHDIFNRLLEGTVKMPPDLKANSNNNNSSFMFYSNEICAMINVFFSHWDSEAMPQQLIQQTRGQAFGRFVWNFRMQFVSRLVTEYAETQLALPP